LRKGLASMTGRWMCAAVGPARVSDMIKAARRVDDIETKGSGFENRAVNLEPIQVAPLTSPS
jgi:hypothetical protein